jgi:hypothetical protein
VGRADLGGLHPLRIGLLPGQQRSHAFALVGHDDEEHGMPSFASHGMSEDSWKLVLFIRHLPQLTAEERIEMSRFNPKSPEDREEEKNEDEFLNGTTPPKSGTPKSYP